MYVYNSANCINNNFFSQDMKIAKVLCVLYTVAGKSHENHENEFKLRLKFK